MCANRQSNRLNNIAVRASYILTIWSDFLGENQEKPGGGLSPPRKKPKKKPVCLFEFWGRPLNWQSFIEIGEMACSTTARCSRGHALNISDTCDSLNLRNQNIHAEILLCIPHWVLHPVQNNILIMINGSNGVAVKSWIQMYIRVVSTS